MLLWQRRLVWLQRAATAAAARPHPAFWVELLLLHSNKNNNNNLLQQRQLPGRWPGRVTR
jgi:hypothetical protein